jgi:hypothetical protein
MTWQLSFQNSSALLLKAVMSMGHTKVKSFFKGRRAQFSLCGQMG